MSPRSLVLFFVDSAWEVRENTRRHAVITRQIDRFALGFHAVLVASAALGYRGGQIAEFREFLVWTLVSGVFWTVFLRSNVALVAEPGGDRRPNLGAANRITLTRFFLIAPTIVFYLQGYYLPALVTYAVLAISDIVDGLVARWRREQSEFGVVMDPLGDVFSTGMIFAALYVRGVVPGWLFTILMIRYGQLIVGALVLFLTSGPWKFQATLPGKVVGVVQALGLATIIVVELGEVGWGPDVYPWLFPVLGLSFASVVVSQVYLGIRHARNHRA